MKILLAEDNKAVRGSFVAIIKNINPGIKIDEVDNGIDLIEKARSKEYNLIITDNNMPRMTGLKAIPEIRKDNKTIPIWVYSDCNSYEPYDVGANDFYRKGELESVDRFKRDLGRLLTN